jgi:N-acyl-D-aspartate/D-glutamate deacylase
MNHLTMEGRPVASLFADWEEVSAIADVMRRLDAGTIQMTGESAKGAELEDFHRRLWALSAESGRIVLYPMGSGLKYLEVLDEFETPGSRVIGTIHARAGENIYGFRTTLPFDRFPTWKAVRSGSLDEQRAKLQDPAIREQLVYEAVNLDYGPAAGAEPTRPDFDTVMILKEEGRDVSVGELARRAGTSPVDVIIDIGLETNFDQLFVQPRTEVSEQRQMSAFRHPRTVIASSDAGAHISQLLNNDPTYVLSELVRARQLLTLEEAVKLLTADPASIWGFHDRGVLRAGNAADVVVFDEDAVGYGLPSIVNDLPDDGPRLVQPSTGIAAVVVNGEFASRDGEPTGARPGALLRQRA